MAQSIQNGQGFRGGGGRARPNQFFETRDGAVTGGSASPGAQAPMSLRNFSASGAFGGGSDGNDAQRARDTEMKDLGEQLSGLSLEDAASFVAQYFDVNYQNALSIAGTAIGLATGVGGLATVGGLVGRAIDTNRTNNQLEDTGVGRVTSFFSPDSIKSQRENAISAFERGTNFNPGFAEANRVGAAAARGRAELAGVPQGPEAAVSRGELSVSTDANGVSSYSGQGPTPDQAANSLSANPNAVGQPEDTGSLFGGDTTTSTTTSATTVDATTGVPDAASVNDGMGTGSVGTSDAGSSDTSGGGGTGTSDNGDNGAGGGGDAGAGGYTADGGYISKSMVGGQNPKGPDDGTVHVDVGEYVLPTELVSAMGNVDPRVLEMLLQMIMGNKDGNVDPERGKAVLDEFVQRFTGRPPANAGAALPPEQLEGYGHQDTPPPMPQGRPQAAPAAPTPIAATAGAKPPMPMPMAGGPRAPMRPQAPPMAGGAPAPMPPSGGGRGILDFQAMPAAAPERGAPTGRGSQLKGVRPLPSRIGKGK
jgi:hypothetical protein